MKTAVNRTKKKRRKIWIIPCLIVAVFCVLFLLALKSGNLLLPVEKKDKQYFDEVFAFGGNVIRIPVHPYAWEQDEYYLWRYFDPIVEWAVENNRYVIIDMHCIGNISTGAGEQMPVF